MIDRVNYLALVFLFIGCGMFVSAYCFFALLIISSEKMTRTIRVRYLESILKQESAWFDVNNPSELNARIGKECISIQKAIGDKMGSILMSFCMSIAGLAFAFSKGWSFSLVILATFPFMMTMGSLMRVMMASGFK